MIPYAPEAIEIKDDLLNGREAVMPEYADVAAMASEEALEFLNGIRGKMLAIAAVFGDMAMRHADVYREALPPHGLGMKLGPTDPIDGSILPGNVRLVESLDSLRELGVASAHTFRGVLEDFFDTNRGNPHFDSWYDNLDLLLGYFRVAPIQFGGNYKSPEEFLGGGFGTAIDVNLRTLDLVDEAHEEFAPDASDSEMRETARRAKRIPYRIGMAIPLEQTMQAFNALGGVAWHSPILTATAFSMDRFTIKPDSNNPNVLNIKYGEEALSDPSNPDKRLDSISTNLDHLKCPGMVDFDETESPYTRVSDTLYLDMLALVEKMGLWRRGKRLALSRFSGV